MTFNMLVINVVAYAYLLVCVLYVWYIYTCIEKDVTLPTRRALVRSDFLIFLILLSFLLMEDNLDFYSHTIFYCTRFVFKN